MVWSKVVGYSDLYDKSRISYFVYMILYMPPSILFDVGQLSIANCFGILQNGLTRRV